MINAQLIIAQLQAFLQGILVTKLPLGTETGLGYLNDAKTRLTAVANNAATGDLDLDDVKQALLDEKDIFITEVKSFEVLGLSIGQETVNNISGVLNGIFESGITP